ncbi:hypothetical protein ATN79_03605 [Paraburkholderia caribensis]|nr:hypothetical protein ATN79_03605 [Paraburkholderia caribensis]
MNTHYPNGFDPDVFALTDIEKVFGPDDAAWQFLKWNPDYGDAYRQLREEQSEAKALEGILSYIEKPHSEMIACAHDISCRERFGIAAWLDPNCERLPALKNPGDSWFFPLRRVDQQDSVLVLRKQGQRPEKLDWYPWRTVHETPFGYGSVITPGLNLPHPKVQKKKEHKPRLVSVAFDCSIPPDGQLLALEALARKHREYWNDRICTTKTSTPFIEPMGWRDIFRPADYIRCDWSRTVSIDALGPIRKQIDQCRVELEGIYRNLDKEYQDLRKKQPNVDEGKLFRHFGERFPMPKPRRGYEPAPESNRYLKALLLIAERVPPDAFRAASIDAENPGLARTIAEEMGVFREKASPPEWLEVFVEGMRDTHLRRAKNLVNYFYAWLVHAQVSFVSDKERKKSDAT